ncbi:unnamed protein product [Trichobilharzia regenti]|uniref:Iron-sulfur cluster assembly 1 homolog, mitochondrial n=1 Tax=Trichobilharzia regenti TaxID=157069 RepID=A0A183VQT3_TRIRE|nr:unnamed protein product [Trichobilharzia regenti]VDP98718.1 unnamed protein product [Trichobilharzia regenti]
MNWAKVFKLVSTKPKVFQSSVGDNLIWKINASYFASKPGSISSSVKTTARSKPSSLVGKHAPITLTKSAIDRVQELLQRNPEAIGLRIGVRTRGCNGLSYTLDFCFDGLQPGDEVVEQAGVRIFIDRRAQLTLLGTEMDYQQDILSSQFVFNNPNIKGTCGCGESFSV